MVVRRSHLCAADVSFMRFFHNPVEVRHELARRGYTPQRISQLVKDCEQWPPRDQRQRERQTFQDQPNMKKEMIPQISN